MVDVREASGKELQDFRKEAQLLASFKHPFIVDYRSNFLDGGYLCIFMAYCEGGDLATQISLARDAQRRIAEAQVLRWMTQAQSAREKRVKMCETWLSIAECCPMLSLSVRALHVHAAPTPRAE